MGEAGGARGAEARPGAWDWNDPSAVMGREREQARTLRTIARRLWALNVLAWLALFALAMAIWVGWEVLDGLGRALDSSQCEVRVADVPVDGLDRVAACGRRMAVSGDAVKPGELVGDFELADQHGSLVTLVSLVETGPLVLFFYPKAMTPG